MQSHTVVDVEDKIKVNEFIDFLNKYPWVIDNIKSAPSQILYTLEQSENPSEIHSHTSKNHEFVQKP